MSIEAMKQMANYIDALGGDSTKYRQAVAEAEKQTKREWVDLTREEINAAEDGCWFCDDFDTSIFAERLTAKLKEKNT